MTVEHLAAYRVTRPARVLTFVALPAGVPWQAAMIVALRGQAATWGGAANLVVPWTDDLIERPELWKIATALDPDVVAVERLKRADFGGMLAEGDAIPDGDDPLGRVDGDRMRAVFTTVAERLPVLQREGHARPLFADGQGIGFPCTPVTALGGDIGPASALRCTADLDLGLMLAAEAGDLTDSAIASFAQRGCVITPYDLSVDDARDRVICGPATPGADGAWTVAETGLHWLLTVSPFPVTVSIVVGHDPWDFALGYALRRTTSLAWWIPSSVLADRWTVPHLLQRIDEIGDLAERGVVASLSDPAAAAALAHELNTATNDSRPWAAADDALALVPERPARLFTRVPGLETFALQDGMTGFLPPDLPEVGEAPGRHIYWMSELIGENWQPLPDARLASRIVRQTGYDSVSARPTRAGAAYLCPHFMRMSADLASEVVRPRIAPLGIDEQLAALLDQTGWRVEPSDKGQYAAGATELFGGDDALREALSAASWWHALMALSRDTAPDGTRRGWRLADRRVYFDRSELAAIRAETGLDPDVDELLQRRILMRGFVFRCPLCRLKGWYGADELAERLRCARCRQPFALTDPGWIPDYEPQWRYRLNELLWQFLDNNGDVPLRALREELGIGRPEQQFPTASLHEHDLWEPGAPTPIELDICAQAGPDFWIGEAKVTNTLGPQMQARRKLAGLRTAAQLLRPHGILFVTASDAWTEPTEQVVRDVLGGLPCELRFASCPRPA